MKDRAGQGAPANLTCFDRAQRTRNADATGIKMTARDVLGRSCLANTKVVSIGAGGSGSSASAAGTWGVSINPKRSTTRSMPSPSACALIRCSLGTLGVSAVSTVSRMTRLCSTLLCLRLCSSAGGTPSVWQLDRLLRPRRGEPWRSTSAGEQSRNPHCRKKRRMRCPAKLSRNA